MIKSRVVNTKVVVKEEKLSVAGVTATNGTTLTVTGTKLGDLVAADITVVGNLVSSYTAAEDGKTATVKLAASLVPDEDTKVTIKGVDYTVKYSIKADTVAIKDATVDNDTKNQYLAITANGADSSVSDLVANGYTVRFESYKADGMTAYDLLDKDNDPNTTGDADVETFNTSGLIGKPANGLDFGTYKVRIILTKGTSVIKSDDATITVIDQDTLTTGINSVEGFLGANRAGASQVIKSTGDITLVIGEVLTIDKAESATLADEKIKITASSVGNTTVTITFGKVSKAFNVKVVNVARKATSLVVKDAPAKVVSGPAVIPAGAKIKFDDRLVNVYSLAAAPTDTTTIADGTPVNNNDVVATKTWFIVEAKGTVTGTTYTDIVIRNAANTANLASIRVTVVDTKPYVTGGTLRMTSIDDTNLNVNLDNVLNIGAVNALTRLHDGSTVNVVSSDSGTINVYVNTNQGGATVGTTCTCIGSIVVK